LNGLSAAGRAVHPTAKHQSLTPGQLLIGTAIAVLDLLWQMSSAAGGAGTSSHSSMGVSFAKNTNTGLIGLGLVGMEVSCSFTEPSLLLQAHWVPSCLLWN
jgi:hypothetical protein